MKKISWYSIILIGSLHVTAQEEAKSVKWADASSWQEVKEQAKSENKYIFVDVYTTWCGPCKQMEKYTFTNDTVAELLDKKFISVKLQMDKTASDNLRVKQWYQEAEKLGKEYYITAYPTMLFFDPNGKLVNKEMGYHRPDLFLKVVEKALLPGQLYVDPRSQYETLKKEYEKGPQTTAKMLQLYTNARRFKEYALASNLAKSYNDFLVKSTDKARLKKENIEFLASLHLTATSYWFNWFKKNTSKIGRIEGDPFYAKRVLDKVVQAETVTSFLQQNLGGMAMKGQPTNLAEADWTGLYNALLEKHGKELANRNLLEAKFLWYDRNANHPNFAKAYAEYVDRYGLWSNEKTNEFWLNLFCYDVFFSKIEDPTLLNKAVGWMAVLVKKFPTPENFDTYASLLYKTHQKEKAIEYETKALVAGINRKMDKEDIDFFQAVLNKMKAGQKL